MAEHPHTSSAVNSAAVNPGPLDNECREYVIDGSTPVDDVLFASLYAHMDSQVLAHLADFSEPSNKAEGAPSSDHYDDLSSLSSSASSTTDDDDDKPLAKTETLPPCDDALDEVTDDDEDGAKSCSSRMRESHFEDSQATEKFYKQLMCRRNSLEKDVAQDANGPLAFLGIVVAEVDELLTVQSSPPPSTSNMQPTPTTAVKLFDFGTVCFLNSRKSVGLVVDVIGPTASPFYVVRRFEDSLEEGRSAESFLSQSLFVDTALTVPLDVTDQNASDSEIEVSDQPLLPLTNAPLQARSHLAQKGNVANSSIPNSVPPPPPPS